MQRFLSIALALCLGLTLSLDASAGKRMGGGKSFGSAPTHQTRQADAPTSAAQPAAAGTAATAAAGRAARRLKTAPARHRSGAMPGLGPTRIRPGRIRFAVRSEKILSTRFSHDAPVGVKWT